MNSEPTDDPGDTVRLLRPPPKVFTRPRGQTVWMGDVDGLELELVEESHSDPYNNIDGGRP